jgi:hypothetical protein
MRKPVLIAIIAVMLIALCVEGWFFLVHKAALSSAEYDVLSAWITAKANEGNHARKIVILNTTEPEDYSYTPKDGNGQPIPWAETAKSLQEKAPTLQATTIEAFRKANAGRAVIRPSFHIPIDYGLVSSAQLESIFKKRGDIWGKYYEQFPGSQGILTFARVGFNADGTQALLYWSNRCGGLCGGGGYVVLGKHNGQWLIVADIQQFVS